MDVSEEINNTSMAVILFSRILFLYGELLQKKRRRTLARRSMRLLLSRPPRYCLQGHDCTVYRAVLTQNDDVLKKHLRVKFSALQKISALIPEKHHGWSVMFDISVFLFWLACGTSYRVAAESFNISRYTVRNIVHKMLDEFITFVPKVIKYPSPEIYSEIGQGFNQRAKTHIFTNAVGAIDGTHVKITVPTRLRDQYINRKLSTAIQLQAVCGSDGKLYSICTGWPGSVHDQRVLRNSQIYKAHIFPPQGYYLLGDNGYACSLYPISIITPIKRSRPLTSAEKKFNNVHSKARSMIESTFGKLKLRWRSIFKRTLELKITNSIKVVAAACVMHNICLNDGLEFEDYEPDFHDEENDAPGNEQSEQLQKLLLFVIDWFNSFSNRDENKLFEY